MNLCHLYISRRISKLEGTIYTSITEPGAEVMDGNETETLRSIGGNTQGTYRSFDTRHDNMNNLSFVKLRFVLTIM